VSAAVKHTLRAVAQRWFTLDEEISVHERLLSGLVDQLAPQLTAAVGIGPDNASESLLALGDNAERLHTEAAFAKLCGTCPIPASSGKTHRYRLNRGGNRRANRALHRIVVVRMKYHEPTRGASNRRRAAAVAMRRAGRRPTPVECCCRRAGKIDKTRLARLTKPRRVARACQSR
jgi:transposase